MDDIRPQLQEVEDRLRSLREERARSIKVREAARSAAASAPEGDEGEPQFAAARAAVEAVQQIDGQIERVTERQTELLRRLGDMEAGRSGFSAPGVSGWETAARRLDISRGETRVDLAGGALLHRPMAALNVSDFSGSGAAVLRTVAQAAPQDRRFAYPALRQQQIGPGDLAVGGFTISFTTTGLSGLTGLERDPLATDPKAELDANVDWEQKDLRQFAITMDDVPVKLLEAEDQLRALLEGEMQYRLDLALDQHVISGIGAATPPSGSTGTGLIEQTRNAVAASRALGANPSVLLLNPEDAANLDLTKATGSGEYVFAVRSEGSANPLWSLLIRESESITDPILLDPALLGTLFVGTGTVLVDPYSSMERNVIRIRVEIEALAFVRDARGAYVISAS